MGNKVPSYKRRRITTPKPRKKDWSTYTYREVDDEFRKRLHMLFYYNIRDWHEAEDLTQETLLRIWKYWPKIQFEKLSSVIGVITNNVRFDYMRGHFDKPDKEFYEDVLEFECHDEGITDPLRKLIVERAADSIGEFTEVLRDKEREIFLDFYTRDMVISDLCEKYKMSRNNIYVHLHRVRELLHECFSAYDLIPDERWTFGLEGEGCYE